MTRESDAYKYCSNPNCGCRNVEANFLCWYHEKREGYDVTNGEVKSAAKYLIKTFMDDKNRCYGDRQDFEAFVEDVVLFVRDTKAITGKLTEAVEHMKELLEPLRLANEIMKMETE